MAYSDKVLDHYNNPRNVGALDKGSGERRHRHRRRARVRRRHEAADSRWTATRIVDAKFKTFGCGSAIASLVARDRVDQGQDHRRGAWSISEHADRRGALAAAGEDPLLACWPKTRSSPRSRTTRPNRVTIRRTPVRRPLPRSRALEEAHALSPESLKIHGYRNH